MNLRRRFLPLAAVVGAVLLTLWWRHRPHGPTYQGRDVRGWLSLQTAVGGPGHLGEITVKPPMLEAFRAMGTNAIPVLVEAAFDREAAYPRLSLAPGLMKEPPPSWAKAVPDPVLEWLGQRSSYLPEIALAALDELRPPAALLFPGGINRLASSNSWERTVAMQLLGCVSDDRERAASLVVPYLASQDPRDSGQALGVLCKLGPAAVVAVPQLTAWLTDSDRRRALMAAGCLGRIGRGASNALPALRLCFETEKSSSVRFLIATEANDIEPEEFWSEEPTRAVLTGMTNQQTRDEAESVLRLLSSSTNIAPRFQQELSALARTGEGQNRLALAALDALCQANLDPIRKIPVLTDCLSSTNIAVRITAAGWLLDFQPTNELAFASVTNGLTRSYPEVDREWLLARLAKLGAAAAPALPLLRQLHARASPDQQESIADAIHTIEGAH